MPLRNHTNGSNTFYVSNLEVGRGLRWMSASTMMWWYHFHSTSDQEFPNLGPTWPSNGVRLHPYSHETACQILKHFQYIQYGSGKGSGVDVSLNHDVMVSFPPHNDPDFPNLGLYLAGVTTWWCICMTLRQHTNGSTTSYISIMNVEWGLRWMSASTMM